jgi:glyoxalase family protein
MSKIHGIHHITCIAGDPQENLDFYVGLLGMRLVKKSVNQDDPKTYHLFYADAEGRPGTDLTFFPWTGGVPGRKGVGLTVELLLAVPPETLDFWSNRLEQHGVGLGGLETRFGERTLPFRDPHGLEIALVETSDPRSFTPWDGSPVPPDRQIRGLHAARLWQRSLSASADFLTEVMGFEKLDSNDGWHRFGVSGGGSGRQLDIRELPDERRGRWGTGSVHHVAWRVPDEGAELAVRERVAAAGRNPTEVIDRFWFKSVYFLEPGGVLFELATDGPGFTVDEDLNDLGEGLILPPWLEDRRPEIEAALPSLEAPRSRAPLRIQPKGRS